MNGTDEESGDETLPPKTNIGKRKLDEGAADEQPQSKRFRGKRGILKQLVEIPLELLFEILGRLDPMDLLNLARTSKELRELLMNRSSILIWKKSRSNIPGLPECPSDLSEPEYANLAFGKHCHFCLRNLGSNSLHIQWAARLRVCKKCLHSDTRFDEIDDLEDRGYPSRLAKLVPSIIISKGTATTRLYDLKVDSHFKGWYKKVVDKEKWLTKTIKKRKIIDEHAHECAIWFAEMESQLEAEKGSLVEDRKALIVQRIRKKLGWGDELAKISDPEYRPENQPKVVKACQKELTERVLSNLDKFLNEFMEDTKRDRLKEERRALLKDRLPILKLVLESMSQLFLQTFYIPALVKFSGILSPRT